MRLLLGYPMSPSVGAWARLPYEWGVAVCTRLWRVKPRPAWPSLSRLVAALGRSDQQSAGPLASARERSERRRRAHLDTGYTGTYTPLAASAADPAMIGR